MHILDSQMSMPGLPATWSTCFFFCYRQEEVKKIDPCDLQKLLVGDVFFIFFGNTSQCNTLSTGGSSIFGKLRCVGVKEMIQVGKPGRGSWPYPSNSGSCASWIAQLFRCWRSNRYPFANPRYMLLLPSSGLPSINALTPPEWAGIQEMLKDSALAKAGPWGPSGMFCQLPGSDSRWTWF